METKKLKPFDLEKAKAGAKVITRVGEPVRIICWDRVNENYPIVALVERENDTREDVHSFTVRGTFFDNDSEHDFDLFMAPTVVERWVNVYKDGQYKTGDFYRSEEEAKKNRCCLDCVATVKLTWEE